MSAPAPEFSRPVDLAAGRPIATITIAADEGERAALARRFGLLALDRLEADLKLEFQPGGDRLLLSGRLRAALRQSCIVSLELVADTIDERFTVIYAGDVAEATDVTIDPASDDAWDEPWPGSVLDVGEAVAQQLSLAIDPYPRAPGAAAEPIPGARGPEPTRPFAGLSAMVKDRRGRA